MMFSKHDNPPIQLHGQLSWCFIQKQHLHQVIDSFLIIEPHPTQTVNPHPIIESHPHKLLTLPIIEPRGNMPFTSGIYAIGMLCQMIVMAQSFIVYCL